MTLAQPVLLIAQKDSLKMKEKKITTEELVLNVLMVVKIVKKDNLVIDVSMDITLIMK